MLGTPNCGKGEPGQGAHVGHAVPRRPLPGRPGGRRQVVSERTAGRRPAERRLAPRRARPRAAPSGRRDRGRGARRWPTTRALTRFANSEIHQNVAETNAESTSAFVVGQAGRRRVDRTGSTTRGCGASPRRPPRSPATPRSSRTGAACPSRRRSATSPAALRRRRPPTRRRSSGPRASGRSSPPPTTPASSPTARSRPAPRRSRSPTRRASAPRSARTTLAAPDGHDGARRRLRLRRVGGGRRRRRSTPRRSAARPPTRPGRRPTRSRSIPATGRSSSRSTPSSTSSSMLGYMGFSALAVQEERSFAEPGKRDRQRARHDRRRRRRTRPALPMAFDYEGVAKQRVVARRARRLPRRRLRRPDRRPRRPARRPATACRPRTRTGPFPLNMVDGGRRRRRATSSIGGLERGLLVTRFHYTNPVHPKLAIVTGMTRDGTFLVEGGRDRRAGPEPALHPELPRRRWPATVGGRPRAARRSRASSAASPLCPRPRSIPTPGGSRHSPRIGSNPQVTLGVARSGLCHRAGRAIPWSMLVGVGDRRGHNRGPSEASITSSS